MPTPRRGRAATQSQTAETDAVETPAAPDNTENKAVSDGVQTTAVGPDEDKAVPEPSPPTKELDPAEVSTVVPEGKVRVRMTQHLDDMLPNEVVVLDQLRADQVVAGHFGRLVDTEG